MAKNIPEHIEHAIQRTKALIKNGDIQYLAHGMEGTLTTSGTHVYKYFQKGKDNFGPDQLDFIKRKILGKKFKHLVHLKEIVEFGNEIIFIMMFQEGTEYSGGYLQQIREMLTELKKKEIGYRNICPKNMLVSNGRILLCDMGHSFVELNSREYLEMMKRAYLSYRFHFHEDLPKIMREAINNPNMPELFGFEYFQRTMESQPSYLDEIKDGLMYNLFSIFSEETENFKRIVPDYASYQNEFRYTIVNKETGEEKTVTHTPFEILERSYMRKGVLIEDIEEVPSTDFEILAPSSDYLKIKTSTIKRPHKHDVSLLIKASSMEWGTIDFQIKHIVRQLNTPEQFSEVIVVTDKHEGLFLRQYEEPNLQILLSKLEKLQSEGWIDRIVITPNDKNTIIQTHDKWFSLRTEETHASNGQHTYTSIYGFENCKGKYILQLDSDCIITRKDFNHDYLDDMISLLETNENSVSIPFSIGAKEESTEQSSDSRRWRTEVRFSLLHKNRLMSQLPLPNELDSEGKLVYPWHRALDKKIQENRLVTYRRGSPNTFFIHVQNETKKDVNLWYNILKTAEKGTVPMEQYGNVDLFPDLRVWLSQRSEKYVFIIRGQNVELPKLRRMFETVQNQSNKDWGCVFIDAGSDNGMEDYIGHVLLPKDPDRMSFFRNWRPITPIENTKIGISQLVSNNESTIITLDADDALIGDYVLDILEQHCREGADLTVGTMLRTDKHKQYPVDFKNARETNGGNIWQHLRTFKKQLFDAIPIEYFKIDGKWIPHTEDWAFMLPMVDIAKNPQYIKEHVYYYEPSIDKSIRNISERENIISAVINKPKLSPVEEWVMPSTPEPRYTSSLDLIEIDITYTCNLKCNNCNRSCSQAPDNSHMTIDQIHKVIRQTKDSRRKFKKIRILGGEPLLHPDIIDIMNLLLEFRESESPETAVEIVTNGYGDKVREVINLIPEGIEITNTHKTSSYVETFEAFNLAPRDITNFSAEDYTKACWITRDCGMGLNIYGYYQCAVAAGIDRVLGLDIGIKNMPMREEEFIEQKQLLCGYCGHFLTRERVHTKDRINISGTPMSESWRFAYDRYKNEMPLLTEF